MSIANMFYGMLSIYLINRPQLAHELATSIQLATILSVYIIVTIAIAGYLYDTCSYIRQYSHHQIFANFAIFFGSLGCEACDQLMYVRIGHLQKICFMNFKNYKNLQKFSNVKISQQLAIMEYLTEDLSILSSLIQLYNKYKKIFS